MRAKLISRTHGEFKVGEEATIGRSAESSVRIEASVVSTDHARITYDAARSRYMLEDLGSLNGTELDGVRVDSPEPLDTLHLLCFGGSETFIFQALTGEGGSELDTIEIPPSPTTKVDEEVPVIPEALRDEEESPAVEAVQEEGEGGGTEIEKAVVQLPEALAAVSAVSSRDEGGAESGEEDGDESAGDASAGAQVRPARIALVIELESGPQEFELAEGESVLGRSKRADIRLDYPDLSRCHAALTLSGGNLTVRDLGSRNHTFVDGNQTEVETPVPLGSKVVFGRLEARVVEIRETEGG